MRNFSFSCNAQFESYTINGGEYVSTLQKIGDMLAEVTCVDVVLALAAAFETAPSLVLKAWREEALANKEFSRILSPSEYAVLKEMLEFADYVRRAIETSGSSSVSRSFIYINMNTGAHVLWSLHVS